MVYLKAGWSGTDEGLGHQMGYIAIGIPITVAEMYLGVAS